MPHNLQDYDTIMNLLYCGLTQQCDTCTDRCIKNVICADLVSDFPAQMTHEMFPRPGSLIREQII